MDYLTLSYRKLQQECKKRGIKCKGNKQILIELLEKYKPLEDNYNQEVLILTYNRYKRNHYENEELKKVLPIRHENIREDISENIVKFIIINYENDKTCKWAKAINKNGDLYSEKYLYPIEVKTFASDGPTTFGPDKKFNVIYFLDMRKWKEDIIILWKVNLSSDSIEIKNIKMNKHQTHFDQCIEGRRPRISWDTLYPQISEHCIKIYEGTFENIFIDQFPLTDLQSTEPLE